MKMERTIYICDGCRKEVAYHLPKDWFEFGAGYHFCCECGHLAHAALNLLGVKHTFVCHQYSDDKTPGFLEL